jgi:hypothetical protein
LIILAGSRSALTELYRVLVFVPHAPLLSPVSRRDEHAPLRGM